MRSTPVTRRAGGIVLALLLLLGAGRCGELAPLAARAEATPSPVPTKSEDSPLAAKIGRLPDPAAEILQLAGHSIHLQDDTLARWRYSEAACQRREWKTSLNRMICRFLNRSCVDRRESPRPWRR
jgi:hypothetical protein